MYADVLSAKESRDLYDWMKQNKLPIYDNALIGYAEYDRQYPKCRIIQAYRDGSYTVVWPDIAGQPRLLHTTNVVLTDSARARLYGGKPLVLRRNKRQEWQEHFAPHICSESPGFSMPTTNLREFLDLHENATNRSLKIRLIELMLLFKPSMLTENERSGSRIDRADRGEFKLIQAIRGTCMPSFSHVLMCALTCVYADKLCPDFDLQDPDNWINANLLISSCFTHACMHTHART